MTAQTPAPLVVMSATDLRDLVRDAVASALAEMAPPAPSADGVLDRAGAARWLGISLAKLDGLCRREADPVPFLLCGDVRRFERDELRAWLRRQGGNQ